MSFAEIKKENVTSSSGMPELYVDGKKVPPLFYALSDIPSGRAWTERSQKGIKQFAECGIDIVCIDTNLYEGWNENGDYSPESTYKEISAVIKANPNAKVIVRLHMNAPYWWMKKNSDELLKVYGKQSVDSGFYPDRILDRDVATEVKASAASEKWINDASEMLRQYCVKIKASAYGKYLIGIQPAYGTCGEWHSFGGLNADYSAPMTKLFRSIVKEKYKTEKELKRFYGENASFDNIEIPLPTERAEYDCGKFFDPVKDAPVVDSFKCYSVAAVRAISRFCRVIKEAWGNGILAGSFYGYFFGVGGVCSAHLETKAIFDNRDIDFLAAPSAYLENKFAGNANVLRYLPESNRINGKLMLCEMDQGYSSWSCKDVYTCDNEEEYSAIVKRNVLENILHGNGAWYYEHRLPTESIYKKDLYWDTPERLATIKEIQKVCKELQNGDFVKSTDVLIVQSTEAVYCQVNGWFPLSYSHEKFIDAISKSGAGYDQVYLSDLEKCDLSRYKCVLFINCTVLTETQLDYIKNSVMKNGRTVCFMLKCGKVQGGTVSDENVEKLVGCKLLPETFYQTEDCSVYYCENTVYSYIWYKNLFRKAGAHVYTDNGEVVVADNNLVMVHCKNKAKTKLKLFNEEIEINNPPCATYLYNAVTGKRLI